MLIEFRVENHRSIGDEQVLTLEAGRVGDADDPRPRAVVGHPEKVLPAVALYGANASGKTNLLAALAFMKDAVMNSHWRWSPDGRNPRDPFAWGPRRFEPSMFEVEISLNGVRYQYGFRLDDEVFLEEWLFAWPHGRKQTWLERDGSTFQFGENLEGENRLIEGVTRPNALFLSAAAQHKHPQLSRLFSWFKSVEAINVPIRRRPMIPDWSEFGIGFLLDKSNDPRQQGFSGDEETLEWMRNRFTSLLKDADIGVVDMRLKPTEQLFGSTFQAPRIELKHQSETDDAWLPLDQESHGTQTLFRLAFRLLRVIRDGGILLIDELESSLHPNLAERLVRMFNDPDVNTRNAQLIFSTHDTHLLDSPLDGPALRRDQVWLTEKDAHGATTLYPLTDFKPPDDENMELGYLLGRYGAVPILGRFRVPVE